MNDQLEIEEDQSIRSYALELVSEATGGNATFIERLSDYEEIDENQVLEILHEAGVPISLILSEDLSCIFKGGEPRYFISPHRITESYRKNHNVCFHEREGNLDSIRDQIAHEVAVHGVSLADYRRGAACVVEQGYFYESQEWKDRAKVIRTMDRFTCRHCGRKGPLEVHHEEHIYSVYCRKFYRNFDSIRLLGLCKPCHKGFHAAHIRGYSDFCYAAPTQIQEARALRKKMTALHDLLSECPFCFGHRNPVKVRQMA